MQSRSVAHSSRELARLLREELDGIEFPFPAPASATAESKRAALITELDQEVIPMLDRIGDPALIALAGPTGVGKSVLANTLIGGPFSAVGALRPTTTYPQLLAHPDTIALQGDHPVRSVARLATFWDAPATWAVLDCGDPFAAGNDPPTAQPDLDVSAWLVVTSALRYGDGTVWDLLRTLAERPQPVALVVNRVPEGAWEAISADIEDRIAKAGLDRVELFEVAEADGQPEVLPESALAPLREWLTSRFPVPDRQPDSPDLRVALGHLATAAADLANAQAVHRASVDLLRTATEAQLAGAAEAAGEFEPGPVDPRLTEAWLDQIGPDGPLASVDPAQDSSPERRARIGQALAALGRAVSDAVQSGFRDIMTDARAAMASLWQGEDVPEGTRALLQRRGLAEADLAEDLAGSAGYGLWVEGLAARLRKRDDPATRTATEVLTRTGLVSLVQAAVLGAEGPAGLAAQLLGGQYGAVMEDAREALREARAGSIRLALAVFADTVRELERTASGTLSRAADRLAYAAKKVDQ
ncbi:MAG: hypothetical protein LBK95_09820 [Bifidobacteriaceae bacterium]|jgi:hypothetical protein|nr:hypothetical protein [Bifidobacteriaceae bacterium]